MSTSQDAKTLFKTKFYFCMYISVCQSQILKEQPITGNPEISKLIEKFADIGLKIFKGKGQKKSF